jgi:hypothetical protein
VVSSRRTLLTFDAKEEEDEDEEEEEEEEMRARGIKAALLSLKIFDYLMSDDDLSSTVLNHTNKLLSLIAILRGFFPAQNARLESTNNLVLGPAQQEMDKLLVAALNTYLKVLLVAAAKQVDMIAADAELPPPPDMQQVIAWAEEIVVPALKSIDSDGAFTADVAGSKYYLPKQTMALILVNISDVISCGMLDQPLRDQIISMITALVTAKIEPAVMESLIPVIGKIAFLIFSRDIMTQEDFSFESDRCVMMKVLENTPASQLMSLRFPLTLSLKAAEMYGHVEMTREMLKFLAAHVAVVVVEESKKTGENPAGKSKEEEIKGGLTNISDLISFAINNSGTTCKNFCSKIIAQNVKDIAGFDRLSALLS